MPFSELSDAFEVLPSATDDLIDLLDRTELGTNGARYRHLDTREKIDELADDPVFLLLRPKGRLLGNLTFCRRDNALYIRYVAMNPLFQGSGKARGKGKSLLRSELCALLDRLAENATLYAYIEPRNARSLVMAETFGFRKRASLVSQTFSRLYPRKLDGLSIHSDWNSVATYFRESFSDHAFYFETHLKKGPFAVWSGPKGVKALARVHEANWEISRFPGKYGGVLRKTIPYIPLLRKLIRPASHRFTVVDSLVVLPGNEAESGRFLEGILHASGTNMLMWWTDSHEKLYRVIRDQTNWGLVHRFSGAAHVDCLIKGKSPGDGPVYVNGGDLI